MKHILLPVLILISGFSEPSFSTQTSVFYSPFIQLAQAANQNLDQAVQKIKQQTGGRILSAKTVKKADRQVHVIKVLLPSGKVRTFKINAR